MRFCYLTLNWKFSHIVAFKVLNRAQEINESNNNQQNAFFLTIYLLRST